MPDFDAPYPLVLPLAKGGGCNPPIACRSVRPVPYCLLLAPYCLPLLPALLRTTVMIAAVDAGGTNIKAAAVDPVSLRMSEPVSAGSDAKSGPEAYLAAIARTVRGLGAAGPATVEAVGLSLPGFTDRSTGTWCGQPNVPGWPADGLNLESRLREALAAAASEPAERAHWQKVPIAFGNDADLAGYGEWAHRTKGWDAAKAANLWLLHVTWGTGIGVGHVRNGQVQTGWEGGHVPVGNDPAGPVCGCGRRNCLEAFAAVPRLVGRMRLAILSGTSSTVTLADLDDAAKAPRRIVEHAERGDKLAAELLRDHAVWLAKGLVGLASIGTPDLITIGGGLAGAGDLVLKPLAAAFHAEDAGFIGRRMVVEKSQLGNDAGYIGAAALARNKMQGR